MDDFDLDRELDRELKRLPGPRAPRTLLPRVMAAVGAPRVLPWYSRPWITWPRALQVLSAVLFAGAIAGAWSLVSAAPELWRQVNQIAAVARAFWNVLIGPIVLVMLALTVVVVLACAAAWTAVTRVTLGGASSQ